MFPPQQDTDDLQELSLSEVLQRDDLCVQEVLSIAGIQSKIKQQLRVFLGHCARNESFADRLITLGLKCPMHQSTSPQMQTLTYIAADILTADQDALADFLLPKHPSSDEGEIAEEIQTEEGESQGSHSESERYKWLNRVVEYLQGQDLDENCVNYIVKSIQVLVRKRLGTLLEYLRACPDVLSRLAHLAHFPSIAQLFTKLITDEDEYMPTPAHEARQMVIPLLLQKLHTDMALPIAMEVVDCLEAILQASRYSDPEQARSELQVLSDMIVSAEETAFHLSILLSTPSPAAANAAAYLTMVVNRMNQDESHDGYQRPYRPTLLYQVDPLFASFSLLASGVAGLDADEKLLAVRWLELLVVMGRHSRFPELYSGIPREQRLDAIRKLVWGVARGNYAGVKLQLASSLIELTILQEERISESHPDFNTKISPSILYSVLSDHQLYLRQLVESLGHEGPRQRNRNEQGIFLRKLLVVLDNFFKNSEIHRHFPDVQTVVALFPTFTTEACRQYVQGAAINNHPAGQRAKPPAEFGFIRRNKTYLDSQLQKIETEDLPQHLPQEQKKPKQQIVFKLTQKIRTLKDRVKEKKGVKANSNQDSANERDKADSTPQQINAQEKVVSPSKERSPMPCLLFFVRHLAIY